MRSSFVRFSLVHYPHSVRACLCKNSANASKAVGQRFNHGGAIWIVLIFEFADKRVYSRPRCHGKCSDRVLNPGFLWRHEVRETIVNLTNAHVRLLPQEVEG